MTDNHGDFVWYELMTPDPDAAQEFYGGLFGWSYEEAGFNGQDYRSFSAGGAQVGGFLKLTDNMTEHGARPSWVGYVRVDDVPAAVAKVREGGGQIFMEGGEVPDVGPFAMLADPQGVPFYVIDDRSGQPSAAFARHEPKVGHCAWNELATADQAAAHAFYTGLLGWEKVDTMDMGEMGAYDMYSVNGYTLGAIMGKPPEMPVSMWSYYFRAPDIDDAAAYTKTKGGQMMVEPMEIPGGEFVFTAMDPQGAVFSAIGKRSA